MEKRIRTIWIFSLVSAFLLIGMQGYWLYNQYQHVVNAYTNELAEIILDAGEKEYNLRKSRLKSPYTYVINKNVKVEADSLGENSSEKKLLLSISDIASNDLIGDSLMSEINKNMEKGNSFKKGWFVSGDVKPDSISLMENINNIRNFSKDSFNRDRSAVFREPAFLNLSMNMNFSDEQLHKGTDQAITNFKNPFRTEILDSILSVEIPGITYSIAPLNHQDSLEFSSWQHTGKLLSPHILVQYLYSPFEHKGVQIKASVPSQPLFARMAVQLMLSLGLILLLIGCLVLQIKTILKQKKINEMREEFVNTMIHELKRPVQTLKTFISFLGDKKMRADEKATEQVLQDSMFELDNLSAYLRKLKDMIRADSNDTSLQISKFNIQELIGKIIRLVSNSATKDVRISVRYEMESVWIEADPVHVANIVSNLIENAVKYSGQQVAIEIEARQKGKELWLTVSDNGIGIPYSEQEKVFVKFYRGSNLPDKNIPGIGLGLSYVKLIAEAHKGYVSLLSEIGKGTSVTLYLPQ